MSEHIYEARRLKAWNEYADLGGKVDFETFYGRDLKTNEYIVKLLRTLGPVAVGEPEFNYDDPADAYANPKGGI